MSEPTDPYAGERYDPTLAHCTTLSLHFNGTTLEMRGGSATFTYSAVSGRPDAHGHFD